MKSMLSDICLAWLIMVVINYVYLYVATKFGVFKEFTKWLMTDDSYWFTQPKQVPFWWFFIPPYCMMFSIAIVAFLLYRLLFKPLYNITIYPISKLVVWLCNFLFKPIKRNIFYSELENSH